MNDEDRAKLTPIKLRYKARDFALKTMKAQREQFKRYGVWGDWDEPYLTLLPEYEAKQLEVTNGEAIPLPLLIFGWSRNKLFMADSMPGA